MPVFDLYSTRCKQTYPDTFQYDVASRQLRNQISQIAIEAFTLCPHDIYGNIFSILSREYGEYTIAGHNCGRELWLTDYLTEEYSDTDKFIDVIELICREIDVTLRNYLFRKISDLYIAMDPLKNDKIIQQRPKVDEALTEINERMKRSGFGFEYTNGLLVRIDSQFIHSEVVKPALFILQDFDGARNEFLSAHQHFKQGNNEAAIVECNKSFESIMKSICAERGWNYVDTSPSKKLVETCMKNNLIPRYMQEHFTQFINLLSTNVSTIRNKVASHGIGEKERVETTTHLTSYALHLTASNIVFLGECNKSLRNT